MTPVSSLDPDREYKVWHTIEQNGKNLGHHISDLRIEDDIIYAVFEWMGTHDGEVPSVRVSLDPSYLDPLGGKADFLYQWPVVLPPEVPYERLRSSPDRI